MQFVEIVVRQAHPGPGEPPYASLEQKLRDAERYVREEQIPWPVVADDLEGSVHQVYGGLSDPTYLVDADGRVAFYDMWTHAPTLHRAIEALVAQGGRGVVLEGVHKQPHFLPAMVHGWRGLRKGLGQSLSDMELALPGSGVGTWLGYQLRWLLAPVALRAEPLPPQARVVLQVGGLAAFALIARQLDRLAARR